MEFQNDIISVCNFFFHFTRIYRCLRFQKDMCRIRFFYTVTRNWFSIEGSLYRLSCICNAIIRILLNFGYNFNMLLRVFVICYVSFILSVVLVFHYAFERIICIFIFVYSHVSSLFYMNYFTIGISVYICNFIVGIIMCILKVRLIRY